MNKYNGHENYAEKNPKNMSDTQEIEMNYETLSKFSQDQLGEIWWNNRGTELSKMAKREIYYRRESKIDLAKPYQEPDIIRGKR